jgi:hypothetical protein
MKNTGMTRKNSMNARKWAALLTALLTAAALPGCFNPAFIETPPSAAPSDRSSSLPAEAPWGGASEPFTITVAVGTPEASRSVVGPDYAAIGRSGRDKGFRNFIQLIVVDEEGNLAGFDEARREKADDTAAILHVIVPRGKTYYILALMGYWERNYGEEIDGGDYKYIENRPPTLLSAGLEKALIREKENLITITMQPLVMDAAFIPRRKPGNSALEKVEPRTGKKSYLLSGGDWNWDIEWIIQKGFSDGTSGGDGLEPLVTARKAIDLNAPDPEFNSIQWTLNGAAQNSALRLEDGRRVILNLGSFPDEGEEATVNFNLKYVPFGGSGKFDWSVYNDISKFNLVEEDPVWIIRNGVNDLAQNGDTDFTSLGFNGKNGNGGVTYKVLAPEADEDEDNLNNQREVELGTDPFDPDTDKDGFSDKIEVDTGFDPNDPADNPTRGTNNLSITNGKFAGWTDDEDAIITFTTGGYREKERAYGYYVTAQKDGGQPALTEFTNELGLLSCGNQRKTFKELTRTVEVYIVIMKDHNVSLPVKIAVPEVSEEGVGIKIEW